jgi:hypothetical protein
MKRTFSCLAFLLACGPQSGGDNAPEARSAARALVAASYSVNVTAHGATPAKDDINERAAITTAIAEACAKPIGEREVYFPAGDYTVARPFEPGVKASLIVSGCAGLVLRGDGMGTTTIAQIGTGMLPTNPNEPGTWKLLHLLGDDPVVRDLAFEGGLRTVDTEEQTHLVEVGDSTDAVLENLILKIPQRPFPPGAVQCSGAPDGVMCERPSHGDHTPILCHAYTDEAGTHVGLKGAWCSVSGDTWTLLGWWGGGDCVRGFGEPGMARNVTLRNVLAIDCDRSGLGGQRNIDGLLVENSTFCGEAPWDFEATGGGGLKNVRARGVSLCGGRSNFAATNGGSGANGLTSVDFDCQGGVLTGGGVSALDADVVTYSNCTIDSGLLAEAATIDIRKRGNRVTFRKSTIVRPIGAPVGPVVSITHHSGVAPTLVVFEDVTLVQGTVAPFINANSVSMLQLQRVTMKYLADPWLKPVSGMPPPANHTEAAAIIADTVPGAPQSIGSVVLIDVKLEGAAGSFAELLRQAQNDSWPNPRRVVMANVDVRGVLRNAVLYAKGSAVTPAITFDAANIKHDAPALCMGADCP